MKRKAKEKKAFITLSEKLLNNLESNLYSRRFKEYLTGCKECDSLKFINSNYELEIQLDWNTSVYLKYRINKNELMVVIYSVFNEQKDPMCGIEVELPLGEYLDLVFVINSISKTSHRAEM